MAQMITIIPGDHVVYIDRVAMEVDCTDLIDEQRPQLRVHAVQWNGSAGWIEYENDPFDTRNYIANREIQDIVQFKKYIDQWPIAKAKLEAEKARIDAQWAVFDAAMIEQQRVPVQQRVPSKPQIKSKPKGRKK